MSQNRHVIQLACLFVFFENFTSFLQMGPWASRLLEATSIIKASNSHVINMSELQDLVTILKQKKGKNPELFKLQ